MQVIVGIRRAIVLVAVTDFQKQCIHSRAVDQMVSVAGARTKPGAHAGFERCFSTIGNECWRAFEAKNDYILPRMGMTQRRQRARREPR